MSLLIGSSAHAPDTSTKGVPARQNAPARPPAGAAGSVTEDEDGDNDQHNGYADDHCGQACDIALRGPHRPRALRVTLVRGGEGAELGRVGGGVGRGAELAGADRPAGPA